jgi:iron complex transport system ATP-binding protein
MPCSKKEGTMLSVQDINYSIGKKEILNAVSINFLPGRFNMILGPNGSGKSTLLKIFSGEITHHTGGVYYAGKKLTAYPSLELAKIRGVLSQQPELSFPLTVEEVVMMGRYPHFNFHPNKKDNQICAEVMDRMNIHLMKDRNYLTLSGGEKQRVQFARVLAQIWEKPADGYRYLFLDEPLASLDINYQLEFLQMAKKFAENNTILVAVIHDLNQAIQFADELFFLKEGRIICQGTANEILSADLVKNVFNVHCTILKNPVNNKPVIVYSNC